MSLIMVNPEMQNTIDHLKLGLKSVKYAHLDHGEPTTIPNGFYIICALISIVSLGFKELTVQLVVAQLISYSPKDLSSYMYLHSLNSICNYMYNEDK
jgi:hypothetical protein